MARHEFMLIGGVPQTGERFDRYNPDKSRCVSVEDEMIDAHLPALRTIKTYWHTVDVPGQGFNEAGITLIPPESAERMEAIFGMDLELEALRDLTSEARRRQKWMIHFGI